ncbi:MAG: flagellar basal body L-ring protein FlgH [Hyphomonadaceae bacterium]|nr:flagellar basal body L-ring protein FlgH [Hyphomonadaceae bacterium]
MKYLLSTPALALAVTACASGPETAPVQAPPMPVTQWTPSQTEMAEQPRVQTASLWETSPNSLLALRRAKDVGDLLTVVVEMNDQASLQSSLARSRGSSEDLDISALFGLPQMAGNFLPNGASLSPAFDFNRNSDVQGSGAVNRAEQVTFTLAARVMGVEPNGNLIISGYQQTVVSNEVRYLTVSGVIRAQDVTRENTVTYDKIADAQFSYLSEGEATTAMRRGAVPRLLDRVIPF